MRKASPEHRPFVYLRRFIAITLRTTAIVLCALALPLSSLLADDAPPIPRGPWLGLRGGVALGGSTGEAEADPGSLGGGAEIYWRLTQRLGATLELYRTRFLIGLEGNRITVNTVPLLAGLRWHPGSPGIGDPYVTLQLGTPYVLDVDEDPSGADGVVDPDIYGRGGPNVLALGLGWESRRALRNTVVGLELRHIYARLKLKAEGLESSYPDLHRTELVLSIGGLAGARKRPEAGMSGTRRIRTMELMVTGGVEAFPGSDLTRSEVLEGYRWGRERGWEGGLSWTLTGRNGLGVEIGYAHRWTRSGTESVRFQVDGLEVQAVQRWRKGGQRVRPFLGAGISVNLVDYTLLGDGGLGAFSGSEYTTGVQASAGLRFRSGQGRLGWLLETRYRYAPMDVETPACDIDWDAGGWALIAGLEWILRQPEAKVD